MAGLNGSPCPAMESLSGKRNGAWVFDGTQTPASAVFENIQDMRVSELVENFGMTHEQVCAVLSLVAHRSAAPVSQS